MSWGDKAKEKAEKMCVCVRMNKREMIKEILRKLLDSNKTIGYYHKGEIEKAIMECRGIHDNRTINNWFMFLWKLEFFTQPEQGIYHLNLSKIQELELPLPFQIDPKQRRLGEQI